MNPLITTETPVVSQTDKYQIEIYPRAGVVRFRRLKIKAGIVIPDTKPVFTLYMKDFEGYIAVWKDIATAMLAATKRTRAE